MKWTTEKRRLTDLKENRINPRKISKKQKSDIEESLDHFSLAEIPAINRDNTIIAGHQRIGILKERNPNIEIDVRVPEFQLTEEQVKEYMVRSNKNTGEFDYQMLETFYDADKLVEWGFEKTELPYIADSDAEVTKTVCEPDKSEFVLIKFDKVDDYFAFIEKYGLKEGEKLNYSQWMQ